MGMKAVSAFLRASVRALREGGEGAPRRSARLLLCSTAWASSSKPC